MTWIDWAAVITPWVIVTLVGGVVGAAELVSRYKDDPFAALKNGAAGFYIALNAGAAALALFLLRTFEVNFGSDKPTVIAVYQILLAGVAALAFFRASLFTVRVGSTDIGIGPNLILETLLQALDRRYDRQRAAPRAREVSKLMKGVMFERARDALPQLCINLMQNVSKAEQSAIADEVNSLEGSEMSNEAKCSILGLILMNVVGADVLKTAIATLDQTITGLPPLDFTLMASVARADDEVIVASLPEACRRLTGRGGGGDLDVTELQGLDLPAKAKAPLIVRTLVRHYGEGTVGPALAALEEAAPRAQGEAPA